MPSTNIEVVHQALDAWNRHDVDELITLYHPDIEMSFANFDGWLEAEELCGHDELRRFLSAWLDAWETYSQGMSRLIEVDDERLVSLVWQEGQGVGSGAVTRIDWTQIVTLRDGLYVRIEHWSDRGAALRSVGLPENAVEDGTAHG